MNKILITGGCGFVGHHIVEHFLKNTGLEIVIFDRLSYASMGWQRLKEIGAFNNDRVHTFSIDISQHLSEGVKREVGDVDYILHLAAESHVDRSIENPEPFVMSNVIGTMRILDFARDLKNLKKIIYFSTDEVFGPAPEGIFYKEWDRYNCTNPYSATKAGGEELALAYANCYGIPINITHTMNVFGERQHPEKFIPMVIKKVLHGETIYIHANKDKTKSGSRFYIHARNVANAMNFLLNKGKFRQKYNIVGEKEVDNLTLAQFISQIIGKELKYELVDFHSSRPGHDLRYALDGSKMKTMGWNIPISFEESLRKTIEWTLKYPIWLRN